MVLRYSEAFIEQALVKVYSRGERTVRSVADELNINCHTVKNWSRVSAIAAANLLIMPMRRPTAPSTTGSKSEESSPPAKLARTVYPRMEGKRC